MYRKNKMTNKTTRQIREAVRESRCFKIKAFLGIAPTTEDYRMTANAAKHWYSEARLPREQQIRYLVSKGNLSTLKAKTGNDFYNAVTYLTFAYEDAIEEVERVARKNNDWQQLRESEREDILLRAYRRNSDESRDENECFEGQEEIGKRNKLLSSGSPDPHYDLSLLRRIRSGLKYWDKRVHNEKATPPEISLEYKTKFLQHLEEILGVSETREELGAIK